LAALDGNGDSRAQPLSVLVPGDILVVDFEGGASGRGLLFKVDRATGARTVLSDFSNAAQGPTGQSPFGVVAPDVDRILVVENQAASGAGAVFSIDPATGARTALSDFADLNQGPGGVEPVGIAVIRGNIYVVDTEAGTGGRGALFKVDGLTGQRILLSDFGDSSQGPTGESPTGITRWTDGGAFVVDPDAGTDEKGALFGVSLVNGARTLISDFGNSLQGPTGLNPGGVVRGGDGAVLVVDPEAGLGAAGALFAVEPFSGARTIRSTFGDLAQGPTGVDPIFVEVALDGTVLVTDDDGGTDLPNDTHPAGNGALFGVDPQTGSRILISDFGNTLQGQTGINPVGIAVVPLVQPGAVLSISPFTGLNGVGELLAVHPTSGARVQVSDFALRKLGPLGADPVDVAIASTGDILVVDEDVGGHGGLFEINPANGTRRLVGSFTLGTATPHGVAEGPDGNYLVVTNNGGTGNRGTLVRVNPTSGSATLLSDFGNSGQGLLGSTPEAVMPSPDGRILVLDADAVSPTSGVASGLLFSVDPFTGVRAIVSDFGNTAQGPRGTDPQAMVFDTAGEIWVADMGSSPTNSSFGVVMRVTPSTGARVLVSDFANPAQGPLGRLPRGISSGALGELLVIDSAGGTGGAGALFTVHPMTGVRTRISDFGNGAEGPIGARPQGMCVVPVPAASRCGDGILDPGEECDDGNLTDGDGCSAVCRLEVCATDATSAVSLTRSGFRLNRVTGRYVQSVRITNVSGASLDGPFALVIDNLPAGMTLFNQDGTTSCALPAGSPFVEVLAGIDGILVPGESAVFLLEFVNPANQRIEYTHRFLADRPQR
jgi:cysteine-rich repeat protein